MRVAARVCLMVTSAVAVAKAEPLSPCSGPELILDPPLSSRSTWSHAAGKARRRVSELPDVDSCAKLEVEQTPHAVRVHARSSDGRSVVRDLSGPNELEATVVALLVLPPPGAEPEASPAEAKPAPMPPQRSAPPPRKPASASSTGADTGLESNASLGKSADRGSAFEVALGASARSASYLVGPGARAVLDVRLGPWLLGGVIHVEQLSAVSPSSNRFSMERSGSVGALFGRRLLRSPFYLDVAVEAPMLSVSTSKWDQQTQKPAVQTPEPGENETETETDDATASSTTTTTKVVAPHADLGAGGFVRAIYPFRGAFGMFAELDGEYSLGLLKQPSAGGQPPVVPWSVGLSLGLFWGSR